MEKIKNILFSGFVRLVFAWVVLAFCFETFMIFTHFTNEERERQIANEFAWKFDGRFKDLPENIWYETPKSK